MGKKIEILVQTPLPANQNLKLIKWKRQAQIHSIIQSQNIFLNQNF